jgi:hypothetical protein
MWSNLTLLWRLPLRCWKQQVSAYNGMQRRQLHGWGQQQVAEHGRVITTEGHFQGPRRFHDKRRDHANVLDLPSRSAKLGFHTLQTQA